MTDVVSPETRSRMMSGIRGKNTRPELAIRKFLFASGFRFRLHRKDLPGKPDVTLPRHRVAILVHGCFWHGHEGCKSFRIPASNTDFWKDKISGNKIRDRKAVDALLANGWRVAVIWECAIRNPASWASLCKDLPSWIRTGQETFREYES